MQLTGSGMRQQYLIGHELRNRYPQLLTNITKDYVRFYSSLEERTLESLGSLIAGLVPSNESTCT
jgi:hypothetical protein